MSKKSHLKLNGVIQLTNNLGDMNAFESELLQNKYIKAGWRTRQEVLDLGLEPKTLEERVVVDFPKTTRIVSIGEDEIGRDNFLTIEDFERYCNKCSFEFGKKLFEYETEEKYFYVVPEKNHKEFMVLQNYEIVSEDTSVSEAAEAQTKLDRKAEIAEIKGFITDVNASTKPNWEKKLLKFLIKEAKE